MRKTTLLPIISIILSLTSCKTKQIAMPPVQSVNDSVRIEYRERIEYIPDTVYLTIPVQEKERTAWDSISTLENDYAISVVSLNSNGSMTHSLNTKPQLMSFNIKRQIEYRDSIIYKDKEVRVPYPVEKELGKWEQRKIDCFPYLCSFLLLSIAFIFRKAILRLARRFI